MKKACHPVRPGQRKPSRRQQSDLRRDPWHTGQNLNPEGEKLFPVIQKTVRRYEELWQKEEELQGLIDDGAGTWIFASGKTGDSENCL